MTIAEAIANIDAVKPNPYSTAEKTAWLYTLDGLVKKEVLDKYETDAVLEAYSPDDTATVLLIPEPYCKIYEYYLAGEIDRNNGETALYNNDAALFNSAFSCFRNYYNGAHAHRGNRFRIL
ncbi:MAG: hypothetical protein J5940_00285 [Clostridia bacterium]|nr:hypothetical protein [Clostridia bacterium]